MKVSTKQRLVPLDKIKKQLDLLIEAGTIRIEIPGVLKGKTEKQVNDWVEDVDYIWEKYNTMLKEIIQDKWKEDNKE